LVFLSFQIVNSRLTGREAAHIHSTLIHCAPFNFKTSFQKQVLDLLSIIKRTVNTTDN